MYMRRVCFYIPKPESGCHIPCDQLQAGLRWHPFFSSSLARFNGNSFVNWWFPMSVMSLRIDSGFPWISQLAMFDYHESLSLLQGNDALYLCMWRCPICNVCHRCGFDLWFVSTWLVILGVLGSIQPQRQQWTEKARWNVELTVNISIWSSWKLLFWAIEKRFRKHNATCDKKHWDLAGKEDSSSIPHKHAQTILCPAQARCAVSGVWALCSGGGCSFLKQQMPICPKWIKMKR